MDYESIDYTIEESILTITLNRPDQLNAFTKEMADELEDAFTRANLDDEARAVVITGAGRAFCAGMDLSVEGNVFGLDEELEPTIEDLAQRLDDPDIRDGVRDTGGRVTLAMFACNKPVIAAINGPAVGIGATMTLAADIRIASENARIGFVFGRLGIVNEACSSWFLPRIVGVSRALELLYTADILSPEAALEAGLIRAIYPPDELMEAAYTYGQSFTAGRSPVGTALIRAMIYRNSAQSHPLDAHRIESLAVFYTSIGDGKEGVKAFLDKRDPVFSARVSDGMPPFYPWETES
jgi:enoyl-CoA hydratase/carnithine racemase